MYNKFYSTIVFMFFITTILSLSVNSDNVSDFNVGVFGTSLLTGLRQTGGIINNDNNDEIIYDISFTFSVVGINSESIDYVYSGYKEQLDPNSAYIFTFDFINGFGPVIISLNASTSNAGFDEESIKGFQIGPYTMAKPYMLAWI